MGFNNKFAIVRTSKGAVVNSGITHTVIGVRETGKSIKTAVKGIFKK